MKNRTLLNTIDFSRELSEKVGVSTNKVSQLVEVFERQAKSGLHKGAQLVVLYNGELILDRAISSNPDIIQSNTIFLCFSIAKSFVAMAIHKLAEINKIDLDSPVMKYWPEFGTHGKEKITIKHVLLHQAGVPIKGIYCQIPLWSNWEKVIENVANLKLEYIPGEKTSYHAINYGFILGEVVRRVTNTPIGEYLNQEFFLKLGMINSYLGLPKDKELDISKIYTSDREQLLSTWLFNTEKIRSSIIPAATLNSTARDISIFFQMLLNNGQYNNKVIFQPSTIENATKVRYQGFDEGVGQDMHWALGFNLGGLRREIDPPGSGMGTKSSLLTFGHFGQNSSMVWADKSKNIVVAYTTNKLLDRTNSTQRFHEISEAVWALFD